MKEVRPGAVSVVLEPVVSRLEGGGGVDWGEVEFGEEIQKQIELVSNGQEDFNWWEKLKGFDQDLRSFNKVKRQGVELDRLAEVLEPVAPGFRVDRVEAMVKSGVWRGTVAVSAKVMGAGVALAEAVQVLDDVLVNDWWLLLGGLATAGLGALKGRQEINNMKDKLPIASAETYVPNLLGLKEFQSSVLVRSAWMVGSLGLATKLYQRDPSLGILTVLMQLGVWGVEGMIDGWERLRFNRGNEQLQD